MNAFKYLSCFFVCICTNLGCGPIGDPDPEPGQDEPATCEEDCKELDSPQYPYSKCVAECNPAE